MLFCFEVRYCCTHRYQISADSLNASYTTHAGEGGACLTAHFKASERKQRKRNGNERRFRRMYRPKPAWCCVLFFTWRINSAAYVCRAKGGRGGHRKREYLLLGRGSIVCWSILERFTVIGVSQYSVYFFLDNTWTVHSYACTRVSCESCYIVGWCELNSEVVTKIISFLWQIHMLRWVLLHVRSILLHINIRHDIVIIIAIAIITIVR